MNERRPIAGYEGLYEIDRDGRVYSLERTIINIREYVQQEKIVAYNLNAKGYLRVALWKDSQRRQHLVHRLVALTFIPNPRGYPLVNHMDENKLNPCDWNLEWCTNGYNLTYSKNRREEEPQYSTGISDGPMLSWTG